MTKHSTVQLFVRVMSHRMVLITKILHIYEIFLSGVSSQFWPVEIRTTKETLDLTARYINKHSRSFPTHDSESNRNIT